MELTEEQKADAARILEEGKANLDENGNPKDPEKFDSRGISWKNVAGENERKLSEVREESLGKINELIEKMQTQNPPAKAEIKEETDEILADYRQELISRGETEALVDKQIKVMQHLVASESKKRFLKFQEMIGGVSKQKVARIELLDNVAKNPRWAAVIAKHRKDIESELAGIDPTVKMDKKDMSYIVGKYWAEDEDDGKEIPGDGYSIGGGVCGGKSAKDENDYHQAASEMGLKYNTQSEKQVVREIIQARKKVLVGVKK